MFDYHKNVAIFVIHEHHATHLHYDLRLEMDGVLKSWAVPKGPPRESSQKRLAIMVDDHELDYADFEGIIPEGEYGAGKVIIWDRGTYRVIGGDLRSGKLEVYLNGKKLKGIFVLIRMKGKEKHWLFIKKKE